MQYDVLMVPRKPLDEIRSNFQRMIIAMLPICTQRLTAFETVVWEIFNSFKPIWT